MRTLAFACLLFARSVFTLLRRFTVGPRRPDWSIAAELAQMGTRTGLLGAKWWGFGWLRELQATLPARGAVLEQVDFEVVEVAGVPCEWCRPKGVSTVRTLVYLHGGGYVVGSVDSYRELIARLAVGARASVLAPNYRLAPEHRFPAAGDDCEAVFRELLEDVSPDRVALAGDSAGGALCIDLLCRLRDAGGPLPAAALLFSPWVDPLAEGGSLQAQEPFDAIDRDFLLRCIETYMDGGDANDPRVALVRADLSGLPPVRIAVGTCEVMLDQGRELAKSAAAAGVDASLAEYQDCFHTFQNLAAFIPTAEAALADSCRFLAEHLRSDEPSSGQSTSLRPIEGDGSS